MSNVARAVPPLPSNDIRQLLQGIFTDPDAPPALAIEAFTVTAASLYQWCDQTDIECALAMITPIITAPMLSATA